MDLNGSAYMDNLENLVKQGRLSEKDIEVACRRVLEAKYKLGLFEDPYRYLNLQRYQREIHTDEARQLSREIARECQVLLKNEANVLPLSKSAKIAWWVRLRWQPKRCRAVGPSPGLPMAV